MKVKALVDFGGQYAMLKGSERELPDNPVTRGLIAGGFVKELEEEAKPKKAKKSEAKEEKA